jgi:hypothetical protein
MDRLNRNGVWVRALALRPYITTPTSATVGHGDAVVGGEELGHLDCMLSNRRVSVRLLQDRDDGVKGPRVDR